MEVDRSLRFREEETVEVLDGESRPCDGFLSVTAGVPTADEERPGDGVQQALNSDETGGIGADAFQETELSPWFEYEEGFVEGRVGIGDRAKHEREHRGIEALTGNGEPFSTADDDRDRNGRLLRGGFSESPQV